jgi:hypothetical protein
LVHLDLECTFCTDLLFQKVFEQARRFCSSDSFLYVEMPGLSLA